MTHESLLQQWLAWLDTVPGEFLFLLALPALVAAAGLLRLAFDRRPAAIGPARNRPQAADLAAPEVRH